VSQGGLRDRSQVGLSSKVEIKRKETRKGVHPKKLVTLIVGSLEGALDHLRKQILPLVQGFASKSLERHVLISFSTRFSLKD
jgi:hypothetical protein